jgi:hypothetical protein
MVAVCAVAYLTQLPVSSWFSHTAAPVELRNWQTRNVAGVLLEAPGDLKPETLDIGPVKKLLEKSEYYTFKTSGFEIGVTRSVFRPEIQLDIDGAVNGAVSNVSNLDGVQHLNHTVDSQSVSGKSARRISMNGERGDGRIYNQTLIILDGHTMYQTQVIYDSNNANAPSYAKRVIDSIKLAQ